jgi:hypothetical protein
LKKNSISKKDFSKKSLYALQTRKISCKFAVCYEAAYVAVYAANYAANYAADSKNGK